MTPSTRPTARVLLVGPDGTGKSTVAAMLAERLSDDAVDVVTGHYRPGLLWKRSESPVTDPHGEPSRPSASALAKVGAVYADFVLGYVGPWRSAAAKVVILERGWWDHLVDPVRYRLPSAAKGVVRTLGRTLPKADIVAVLAGDAEAIVARKPELDVAEVQRQLASWRLIAPTAGRTVIEIDTVANDADGVVNKLLAELGHTATGQSNAVLAAGGVGSSEPVWRSVPGTPARVALRATGGPDRLAALALYQPMSTAAKVAGQGAKLAVRAGLGARVSAPVPDAAGLFASAGVGSVGAMVAMDSSTEGRVVLGAASSGVLVAVAKVGRTDDESLINEGRILEDLSTAQTVGFEVPELAFAGVWNGRPSVVARAVGSVGAPPTLDEALALAVGLADVDGRFLTHGDLAPWNVRRTAAGLALVDFEHAAWEERPLADLAHFLVQTGALTGARPVAETAALLCEPGGLGRRYLDAIGASSTLDPATLVADYVHRQLESGRASTSAEQNYLGELGQQVSAQSAPTEAVIAKHGEEIL